MTATVAPAGEAHSPASGGAGRTAWLSLGALGIVFGDIGTSPLYALKETFVGHHHMPVDPARVFGVCSIIFWTMLLVVTLKYVTIMMRADNKGEGGSLSLLALISRHSGPGRWTAGLTMLGVFSTALFFGDAMITPAVSVLSAVEGLEILSPAFERYVVPGSIVILILLFAIQKRGTERVGAVFGPIMLVYFAILALLGLRSIAATPHILAALLPIWGIRFIAADPGLAFLALGSIVLAVTGAETLYADMSHFGRRPIRLAWLVVAFPTLMLNYLGQAALLLRAPAAVDSPFYLLAPPAWRFPLVILATVATVIASQAVITGAYSVIRQAVQLGLFPRLRVLHTSDRAEGQIYIPLVNWTLLATVALLVLAFQTSSNLASAYGIAVTGTMFITTVMLAVVLRRLWKWPLLPAAALVLMLGTVDLVYFASNLTKFADGGWFPLLVAAIAFTLLTTWAKGRALVHNRLGQANMPLPIFVKSVEHGIHRVRGTAVYLTASKEGVPPSLLHNLKHNQVLHESILLVTVSVLDVPHVPEADRADVEPLGCGMKRVVLRYGFSEDPDIPAALAAAAPLLGPLPKMTTSYFISRQTVIAARAPGMAKWRERIFAWMVRNSATAMEFFKLPPNRVVELGSQVEI
ncbi:MAG: potassium transporter Kup [Alphaproteobacteria bacterium]|nr:potassium transporter Kup [Alphaproteobacteria bacterium]